MTRNERIETLWFLVGAFAGIAVGILYAPRSGADTRRDFFEKADRAVDSITHGEFAERTRDLYQKGRQLADEAATMVDEGRRLVELEG